MGTAGQWVALVVLATVLCVGVAVFADEGGHIRPTVVPEPAAPAVLEPAQPPPPPTLRLIAPAADQGYPVDITGVVSGARVGDSFAVDFGDGTTPEPLALAGDGTFAVSHLFVRGGLARVVARATGPSGELAAETDVVIAVAPRRVLFIQGINSESSCPGGQHFADRAPGWVDRLIDKPAGDGGASIEDSAAVFFSYSSRWCDGGDGSDGAAADYSVGDTCGGVAAAAGRFRTLVDALSPSRVTVVAHSMGGVIAAYAVAADPAWGALHIASVVTFDSPLHGINTTRSLALDIAGAFSSDCGNGDASVRDLASGSAVMRAIAGAAKLVPFYTLDGSGDESAAFVRMQAVPSGSTSLAGERIHAIINEDHSSVWGSAPRPGDAIDKGRFVVCAVLLADAGCLAADSAVRSDEHLLRLFLAQREDDALVRKVADVLDGDVGLLMQEPAFAHDQAGRHAPQGLRLEFVDAADLVHVAVVDRVAFGDDGQLWVAGA